jgi:hypothetical protein
VHPPCLVGALGALACIVVSKSLVHTWMQSLSQEVHTQLLRQTGGCHVGENPREIGCLLMLGADFQDFPQEPHCFGVGVVPMCLDADTDAGFSVRAVAVRGTGSLVWATSVRGTTYACEHGSVAGRERYTLLRALKILSGMQRAKCKSESMGIQPATGALCWTPTRAKSAPQSWPSGFRERFSGLRGSAG